MKSSVRAEPSSSSFELTDRRPAPPPSPPLFGSRPSSVPSLPDLSATGTSTHVADDRWQGALRNLESAGGLLEELKVLLNDGAVYADEQTYMVGMSAAKQSRRLQNQDRRIKNLEKDLDSAVAAAAQARASTRQMEIALLEANKKCAAAEEQANGSQSIRAQHAREIEAKDMEIEKKTEEIRMLKAIVETLSEKKPPTVRPTARLSR